MGGNKYAGGKENITQVLILLQECKAPQVLLVGIRGRTKANHLVLEEHPNSTTRVQQQATTVATLGSPTKAQVLVLDTKMMVEIAEISVVRKTITEEVKVIPTKTTSRRSSMMSTWDNKSSKVGRTMKAIQASTSSRSEETEKTGTSIRRCNRGPT